MRVKFQADADLDARVIRGLRRRQPEIDFQTAEEAGLTGLSDPDVLRVAADLGRILVTHDRRTMPVHLETFIASQTSQAMGLNVFTLFSGFGIGSLLFGEALRLGFGPARAVFCTVQLAAAVAAISFFRYEIPLERPTRAV